GTARTGIVRPETSTIPRGSSRKVRHQLRGFRLHDRTNTRPSTTTAQIPMIRCGCVPARIPRILPSRMASRTPAGNRFLPVVIALSLGGMERVFGAAALGQVLHAGLAADRLGIELHEVQELRRDVGA